MKRLDQSGFSQWVILLILVAGIFFGVFVAQVRTNLIPQAAAPKNDDLAQTSLSLKLAISQPVVKNQPFVVNLFSRSDLDLSRLISAQLKYDPLKLELLKVIPPETSPSAQIQLATSAAQIASGSAETISRFHHQWLESLFDPKEGKAALTALFDGGDFKTLSTNPKPLLYTTILFRPKSAGETEISFDNTSVILRTIDSANILTKTENLKLTIVDATASAQMKEGK